MQRIALFGAGIMASAMGRNLLAAGYSLTVFNRSQSRAHFLLEAGAKWAATPAQAIESADIAISVVADDNASRGIWLGDGGALRAAPKHAVLIESSTLSVDWVNELAAAGTTAELGFLDAPVSGSKSHAQARELVFLVGGDATVLESVRPALMAMGRAIVHLGPAGSGAKMKLINNLLGGVQTAALAEGLAMAEKLGLDRRQVVEIITNGAPGSPFVKSTAPRMLARDYTLNFSIDLMEKDLNYALAEGERNGMTLSVGAAARDLYHDAAASGLGEQDLSAVIEVLRKSGE